MMELLSLWSTRPEPRGGTMPGGGGGAIMGGGEAVPSRSRRTLERRRLAAWSKSRLAGPSRDVRVGTCAEGARGFRGMPGAQEAAVVLVKAAMDPVAVVPMVRFV